MNKDVLKKRKGMADCDMRYAEIMTTDYPQEQMFNARGRVQ